MSEQINEPAQIEDAFAAFAEAADQFAKRMRGMGSSTADVAAALESVRANLAQPCACFPGTCRGGQVIDGLTVSGQRCKIAAGHSGEVTMLQNFAPTGPRELPVFRRTDTKAELDKVDERLSVALLRAEFGERAVYLARRFEEVSGRFRGVEPLRGELVEAAKILRMLAP